MITKGNVISNTRS